MIDELKQNLTNILEEKNEKIIPENIKEGITILGIEGTVQEGINTSDATATANDIISPKTAYINNEKVQGSIIPSYYTNTDDMLIELSFNMSYPTNTFFSYAISNDGTILFAIHNPISSEFASKSYTGNIYILENEEFIHKAEFVVIGYQYVTISDLGAFGNPNWCYLGQVNVNYNSTVYSNYIYDISNNSVIKVTGNNGGINCRYEINEDKIIAYSPTDIYENTFNETNNTINSRSLTSSLGGYSTSNYGYGSQYILKLTDKVYFIASTYKTASNNIYPIRTTLNVIDNNVLTKQIQKTLYDELIYPNYNLDLVVEGNELKHFSFNQNTGDYTTTSFRTPITFPKDPTSNGIAPSFAWISSNILLYFKGGNVQSAENEVKFYKVNIDDETIEELTLSMPLSRIAYFLNTSCISHNVFVQYQAPSTLVFRTENNSIPVIKSLNRLNKNYYNTQDTTALGSDIISGKSAYNTNGKVIGTLQLPPIDTEGYNNCLNLTNQILGRN